MNQLVEFLVSQDWSLKDITSLDEDVPLEKASSAYFERGEETLVIEYQN